MNLHIHAPDTVFLQKPKLMKPLVLLMFLLESLQIYALSLMNRTLSCILILLSFTCFRNDLVPLCFPTKVLYAFLSSLTRVACPDHLILLDSVVLILFHESSSLRNFLQFLLLPSFQVRPSILLRTRSQTHSTYITIRVLW